MEGYLGQVILWAPSFAPRNWAFCNGQTLAIANYDALYSLLGTTYGGDGRVTFKLPDLRGRTAIGPYAPSPLTSRAPGQIGGAESRTFSIAPLATDGDETSAALVPGSGGPAAATGRLDTMPPFLAMNYIICITGTYPSRP